MKKLLYIVPVILAALAVTVPAGSQTTGCTDSPENPTAVLGIVVGAASLGYMQLRNRFGFRKK
jgi:XrtJ-associated TM-motif-TM protein